MLQNLKYKIFWIYFSALLKKINDRSVLSAYDSMRMTAAWFWLFTIFVKLLNFDLFIISFLLKNFLKNEMRVQWFSLFGIFRLFLFFTISHDLIYFFEKWSWEQISFVLKMSKSAKRVLWFSFFCFFSPSISEFFWPMWTREHSVFEEIKIAMRSLYKLIFFPCSHDRFC